jgi:hypothetical protein
MRDPTARADGNVLGPAISSANQTGTDRLEGKEVGEPRVKRCPDAETPGLDFKRNTARSNRNDAIR